MAPSSSAPSSQPTDTAGREIVISRTIAAPRTAVFRAWTLRDAIDQWWGPDGFKTTTHEMDVRPGGRWRFTMHGPDGTDYHDRIVYREVAEPERLVYEHGSDLNDDPERFHVTVTFEERNGGTLLTMRTVFGTTAQRDTVISFGAVELGQQTLGRLAGFVGEA